jgi:hypothetical protein
MKRSFFALMLLAVTPASGQELFNVSQGQFNRAAVRVQERFPTLRDANRFREPR